MVWTGEKFWKVSDKQTQRYRLIVDPADVVLYYKTWPYSQSVFQMNMDLNRCFLYGIHVPVY